MAASGVGSLLAALWLAFGGRRADPADRLRRDPARALGEFALGASQIYPVSLLLMFVVGFGGILMAATANTTIQLAVPDGLRGRVMSVYTTIFAGSTPIGGPLMGGLASAFGVAVSLAIGGVLSAVVGIGAFAWIRRHGLDRRPLRTWSEARAGGVSRVGRGVGRVDAGRGTPALTGSSPVAQSSTAPNTSDALSPPNPNEVDSTRR